MRSSSVTIRTARLEDAERLAQIYAPYVRDTAITFEYEAPDAEEFRARMEHVLQKYPYLVAEDDGMIVGYAYLTEFHPRAAYGWCAETAIYVDRKMRGGGVGGALYRALEDIAGLMGIINLNACIGYPPVEDEYLTRNSVEFHEHMGYSWVGQFHQCGYKFGRWYDMIWMEKPLGDHVAEPVPVKRYSDVRDIVGERFGIM